MQFNLHSAYTKAAAPRPRPYAHHQVEAPETKHPPPRRARAYAARALAATARRLDGEAARRAAA